MVARGQQCAQGTTALLVAADFHVAAVLFLLFVFGFSDLLLYLPAHFL